jgi:hypothetical protein
MIEGYLKAAFFLSFLLFPIYTNTVMVITCLLAIYRYKNVK